MSYPGTDKKFRVTSTQEGFSFAEDDFTIVIRNRYGQVVRSLQRDDLFCDSEGSYYFTLENLRNGQYYAYFTGSIEDDDYDKQCRVFTDAQLLCEVDVRSCPCKNVPLHVHSKCGCKHVVQYTEVTTVSLDDGVYLADVNGEYIFTSDGKRIQFGANDNDNENTSMGKVKLQMTGDEFKQLIEDNNPNGAIDTLPEMLRAAQGISDTTTIKEDVNQQMSEHDTENEAQDSDIDSIFGEE